MSLELFGRGGALHKCMWSVLRRMRALFVSSRKGGKPGRAKLPSSNDPGRSAKRAGPCVSDAPRLIGNIVSAKAAALKLLRHLRRNPDEADESTVRALYRCLTPADVPVHMMPDYRKSGAGTSFRVFMTHLIQLKAAYDRAGIRNLASGANSKDADRRFALALGVPAPRCIGDRFALDEVPLQPGTVVKPVSGCSSRGVFFVDEARAVRSLKTGNVSASVREGVERDFEWLIRDGKRWMVEEAVLDACGRPGHDLKAFCFYGEVGLFVEIVRPCGPDEGGPRICGYDASGSPVALDWHGERLDGGGVPPEVHDYCARISLAAPVPFLRVDFLRGADGLVLGEITPHPGPIYMGGQITEELDRMLGMMFLDAEARLFRDLLRGKRFDTYREIYGASW